MAEVGRASLPLGVMPDAAKTSSAFVCSKRGHPRRGGGCVGRGATSLALADDSSKASSSDFDATGRHVGHFVAEARPPPPSPLVCAAERPQPSLVGAGTAAAERLGLLLSLLSLLPRLPRLSPGSEPRASRRCWRFAGDERLRMRSAVAGTKVKRRPLRDAPGGGGDGLGGTAAGARRVPFDPRPAAFRGAFGRETAAAATAESTAAIFSVVCVTQLTMAPARCGDLLPTTCQALNDEEVTLRWRPLDDAAACAAYAPPPRDGHTSVASTALSTGAVPGLVSGAASAAAASGIAPDAGESDAPPSQQGMATRVTRKL